MQSLSLTTPVERLLLDAAWRCCAVVRPVRIFQPWLRASLFVIVPPSKLPVTNDNPLTGPSTP